MEKILFTIIGAVGKLLPYRLYRRINSKLDFLYTCWVAGEFKSFGLKSRFARPLYTRGMKKIDIGNGTWIAHHCELSAWESYLGFSYDPHITIGNNCHIGPYNHITSCKSIEIGDGLLTGMYVIITDNNHGNMTKDDFSQSPYERPLSSKGGVKIGKNVWLGDKVAVLGGVSIGNNVIVAANSVVTHDIPDNAIAAGAPAKVVRIIE